MSLRSGLVERLCRAAGALGVAAGCAGMVAMLPSAAVAVLGAVGITGSSALARALSPVAEPLFLASAALLLLGALACSRLVALLAVVGSTLLYLSMFQLASGTKTGSGSEGSMSGMSMQPHHGISALHAEPLSFYLGLTVLVAAFALNFWRRRQRECRPLLRLPHVAVR